MAQGWPVARREPGAKRDLTVHGVKTTAQYSRGEGGQGMARAISQGREPGGINMAISALHLPKLLDVPAR